MAECWRALTWMVSRRAILAAVLRLRMIRQSGHMACLGPEKSWPQDEHGRGGGGTRLGMGSHGLSGGGVEVDGGVAARAGPASDPAVGVLEAAVEVDADHTALAVGALSGERHGLFHFQNCV